MDFKHLDSLKMTKSFFELSSNFIVITDANLEFPGPLFLYVNPAFTAKTGYSMEDLKGLSPRILQGEATDKRVFDRMKEALKRGESFSSSVINYSKDGCQYFIECNISPIKDEEGNIVQFISIQKDVTLSVNYQRSLEMKVQEQVELLRKQNELMELQSRQAAMGEMIDMIAHQWKQPLNVISLTNGLMGDLIDDNDINVGKLQNCHTTIQQQIHHLTTTLDEFRNFFRPNKNLTHFSIANSIKDVLFLTKHDFTKNNIATTLHVNDDLHIMGFENEFKHVILNILSNAKDAFIEKNSAIRDISIVLQKTADKHEVLICDNAGGIPEDIIEHIFKPNVTTKEEGKGTGIGLHMAKMILTKIRASISASNQNNGACFTITFSSTA